MQDDLPGVGAIQAADQVYQRRFTRSGGPHRRQPLALGHVQSHAIERAHHGGISALSRRVSLHHVLEFDGHQSPLSITAGSIFCKRSKGKEAPTSAISSAVAITAGKT